MAEEAQATPPTAVAEEVQEAPLPATTVGAKAPPQLELFNSMTKRKEPFQPLVEGKVAMYVCGVTPYDFSHIGHARAYVAFDVLYR
jgi:cysteinyl-tRNA synthetase